MKSSPTDVSTLRLMPAANLDPVPELRELPLALVVDRAAHDNILDDGLLVAARAGGLFPYFCALDEALRATTPGAILLAGGRVSDVLPSLVELRRAGERAIQPLVVFVRGNDPAEPLLHARWRVLADAVLEAGAGRRDWSRALLHAHGIAARLAGLPPVEGDVTARRRLTVLRFLIARGLSAIEPERDPGARLGYSRAPLDLIAGPELDDDLAALADAGLLRKSPVDRVLTCASCGDARLLFREVCAACGSAELSRGEVIHHYACGSVGEEARFRRGDALVCPWCGDRLRHIGIDHERPAALTRCGGCDTAAAEGITAARCLACGQDQVGSATVEKSIERHELTDAGSFAARLGRF